MIAGLRKKVRNSGEIATWDAQVVHEKDHFEFELGDDPYIKHKPFMGGNRGKVIAAYSVATLKTGEKSREVMTVEQIERVRAMSKAKDRGPWVDHYEEMCRKTVARQWAEDNAIYHEGIDILATDSRNPPEYISDALTEMYGRPETIDGGEIAYWIMPLRR
jgi:recombination protein RecT